MPQLFLLVFSEGNVSFENIESNFRQSVQLILTDGLKQGLNLNFRRRFITHEVQEVSVPFKQFTHDGDENEKGGYG